MPDTLWIAQDGPEGRVIVTDSLTFLDDRVGPADVVVAGSFAGRLAFGLALERGVRGLVAHEAGVGRDGAGIAGLALADELGVPAAAVATMSARLGDGRSVFADGVVSHANAAAGRFGVGAGIAGGEAARRMLAGPPGRRLVPGRLVDRNPEAVDATPAGRVVLVGSMAFAGPDHARDVLCAGSHAGRVNAARLLAIRPRGALFNDGGGARDGSGLDGLALLDTVGVPAAAVAAMSARIGDPRSTYADGVVSAVNEAARRLGVTPGQAAREAARRMLDAPGG